MYENIDEPNELVGSGHVKLIDLDEVKKERKKINKQGKSDGTYNADDHDHEKHPDDPAFKDSPRPSPRPIPTGKLEHNMRILNGALKMIGKVMAYADEEENHNENDSGNGNGNGKMSSSQSQGTLNSKKSHLSQEQASINKSNKSNRSMKSSASANSIDSMNSSGGGSNNKENILKNGESKKIKQGAYGGGSE